MKVVVEKGTIEKLNGQNFTRLYFDKADGKAWANEYADCNSWDNYHSDSIIEIRRPVEAEWEKWTRAAVIESVEWTLSQIEIEKQYA